MCQLKSETYQGTKVEKLVGSRDASSGNIFFFYGFYFSSAFTLGGSLILNCSVGHLSHHLHALKIGLYGKHNSILFTGRLNSRLVGSLASPTNQSAARNKAKYDMVTMKTPLKSAKNTRGYVIYIILEICYYNIHPPYGIN